MNITTFLKEKEFVKIKRQAEKEMISASALIRRFITKANLAHVKIVSAKGNDIVFTVSIEYNAVLSKIDRYAKRLECSKSDLVYSVILKNI